MIESPFLAFIFLLFAALITGTISALIRLGKTQAELTSRELEKHLLLKYPAHFIFIKKNRDFITFALPLLKYTLLICYTIFAFFSFFKLIPDSRSASGIFLIALCILAIFLITDLLAQGLSLFRPKRFFKIASPIVSLLLFLFWPVARIFYHCLKHFFPPQETKEITSLRMKDKILEVLQDPEFAPYLDAHDQKLILSFVSFKERIAREVMVPRIDMFCLSAETTIRETAKSFLTEGYSRIPVYQESVDNIIGVLYYKDVLNLYAKSIDEKQPLLEKSIQKLVKPVVYTPETKKISHLLQEFRNKQIHMAIVVDEYGGTEGIVTIEDILEELVGEIADEYDREEEALYTMLPTGGWIVDAKMNIIDIEEELGIRIPQNPEYDTIGGYIFHKAGTIPSKGWKLHQDEFDIEILSSDERSIHTIRISPNI